jgi:hypothetical protein
VHERLVNRLEAAAEIARQLLNRQRLQRVEQPVARPIVVVEHRAQILQRHGITPALKRRSSRG